MRERRRAVTATVGSVVLNHGTPDDTLGAVTALLRSSYLDQHVVVVDDAADPAARDGLLARLPETVSYLPTGENLGYGAGNNHAVRFLLDAGVRYVCLVNPDARVLPGTVDGLVRTAKAVGDAGAVGPRLVHGGTDPVVVQSDGGRVDWSRGGATSHVDGDLPADALPGGCRPVDYVSGACVLLRGAMLEDVGLLPEDYFLYYEETEHALLAARRGWVSVVDRDVRAEHFRRSTATVPSRAYVYYMTRNRALFAGRHGPGRDAVERGLADLDERFLGPWAERVAQRAPALGEELGRVAEVAKAHGRAGRAGRYDELVDHVVEGIPGWGP